MAIDYQAIRNDNVRRYGTDIARIGHMLLSDRYDDRTHFLFELLQNAEDALSRRKNWQGARSVRFHLTDQSLNMSHFGQPFNEADVRAICGIAESTKEELTAIGRFGIGFKSVYAFTDRPEVHSGQEDFMMESFVWPAAVSPIERNPEETVIILPFKANIDMPVKEVTRGFKRLGARTLLFLRQIEEIEWQIENGQSGLYLRSKPDCLGENVNRISLIGETEGEPEAEETWLVFSSEAFTDEGRSTGHVEIAFLIDQENTAEQWFIAPLTQSRLVVFFPTVLETHLGFLIQGPYRTTPSRDNVPRSDAWNQQLVHQTAKLLVYAIRWMCQEKLFDTRALQCLPMDPAKFGEDTMFAPLFGAVKQALMNEPLLPRNDSGYVPAVQARLGRTEELRELFTPAQLAGLYGEKHELAWLSGDITLNLTPELRRYLIHQLSVDELTPETIVTKLNQSFLEAQTDDWILKLYHFFGGQPALKARVKEKPIIRLENGAHVVSHIDNHPQAFLPGSNKTGFPTVRATVCSTSAALEFLTSLNLSQPDPVDDVLLNILPKYDTPSNVVNDREYAEDINYMINAFATDSKGQREKMIGAMRGVAIIKAVATSNGAKLVSRPGDVYLATERLKTLFAGIEGVLLVDDTYDCLKGEDVREMLEACGATRSLQPIPVKAELTNEERHRIRRDAGLERATWHDPIKDSTLRGLDSLLEALPQLPLEARRNKAAQLWEALIDVENRRGGGAFLAEYTWGYAHTSKTATFDAAFVRKLNSAPWVPDADGELKPPGVILFAATGWKPHPFLQSKIHFKPPILEMLAKEAGIEPGVIDLLRIIGVTSEAELRSRLGIDEVNNTEEDLAIEAEDAANTILGGAPSPTPAVADPSGPEFLSPTGNLGGKGASESGGHNGQKRPNQPDKSAGADSYQKTNEIGAPTFISYISLVPGDGEEDPDGLEHKNRLELEEKAIGLICAAEPELRRTPQSNPGFDLFAEAEGGAPSRWIEVKAMAADMATRPVGLSRTQFDFARKCGSAYWLYVVEHAGDPEKACIFRIQDPAGKARTFLFDEGWRSIAVV